MRFLFLLAIGFFVQTTSFAQVDSQELKQEMEKMNKELQEQMKNFNFEDFQLDTMLLKNFNFPEEFGEENFVMPNDIDMNEMLKMMERQMSQLDVEGLTKMMEENFSKIDFQELEKLFEPFIKGDFLTIPAPEGLEKQEEQELSPKEQKQQHKKEKKKNGKKKSYKM